MLNKNVYKNGDLGGWDQQKGIYILHRLERRRTNYDLWVTNEASRLHKIPIACIYEASIVIIKITSQ